MVDLLSFTDGLFISLSMVCGIKYQLSYLFLRHQVVVEKKLMREKNLSRHDVGREKFLCEVGAWFLRYDLFNFRSNLFK